MSQLSRKHSRLFALLLMLMIICISVPVPAQAASIKNKKPKITKDSAYLNNKVYLKWTKVAGAKKYEIQRAKINPKTGKTGKWTKWKATKKTYIKKEASGDYKYRVRAVKGKTHSKWSAPKRVFAANAYITKMTYTPPEYLFGVLMSRGYLTFRVLVNNKTKSPMGFLDSYMIGEQNTVYALSSSGKKLKTWHADVDTQGGIAKQVNANSKQSLYFEIYDFTEAEWAKYKGCKFMITSSFYPNPEVEPTSTQMALGYTKKVSESSIAAK